MEQKIQVALLGATGKAGKYLLQALLDNGYRVNALIRKPENFKQSHPHLSVIKGDIKDYQSAYELIKNCAAVLSTIGQVKDEALISSLAAVNLIKAMEAQGIKRYVFLAGLTLDVPGDQKSIKNQEGTTWMKNTFPAIVADKQKAYQLLTQSSLNWTMLRLPWIEQTAEKHGVLVNLQDCLGESISTSDLADFMIAQLEDSLYFNKAPFVTSTANPEKVR